MGERPGSHKLRAGVIWGQPGPAMGVSTRLPSVSFAHACAHLLLPQLYALLAPSLLLCAGLCLLRVAFVRGVLMWADAGWGFSGRSSSTATAKGGEVERPGATVASAEKDGANMATPGAAAAADLELRWAEGFWTATGGTVRAWKGWLAGAPMAGLRHGSCSKRCDWFNRGWNGRGSCSEQYDDGNDCVCLVLTCTHCAGVAGVELALRRDQVRRGAGLRTDEGVAAGRLLTQAARASQCRHPFRLIIPPAYYLLPARF